MGDFEHYEDYERVFVKGYGNAYECLERILGELLSVFAGLGRTPAILDLGCGDGWMATTIASIVEGSGGEPPRYVGLDPEAAAVERLRKIDFRGMLEIDARAEGARATVFDAAWCGEMRSGTHQGLGYDLVLCNATGHQIRKTLEDVEGVYSGLASLVRPRGRLCISDYHYPEIPDEEGSAGARRTREHNVEFARFWIRSMTGQEPTAANRFLARRVIRDWMERRSELEIIFDEEVRANDDIELHYYVLAAERRA